jgi:hypothetical protein
MKKIYRGFGAAQKTFLRFFILILRGKLLDVVLSCREGRIFLGMKHKIFVFLLARMPFREKMEKEEKGNL